MWDETVLFRPVLFALIGVIGSAVAVIADAREESEPVLRLRFDDPVAPPATSFKLRPRLQLDVAVSLAAPQRLVEVSLEDAGQVGKFAYISTPHPNVIVTMGAADDATEIGRQIDRAMSLNAGSQDMFARPYDRAPFVGVGLRTRAAPYGWSADATIGAGWVNRPDPSRLTNTNSNFYEDDAQAQARAHLRLRYRF